MTKNPILIFCTTDKDETPDWVTLLLERKLIACATKITNCESHYWWEGKLENSKEALWILKTVQEKFEEISYLISQYHHYTTPEIICIPIQGISERYLNWMYDSLHIFPNE